MIGKRQCILRYVLLLLYIFLGYARHPCTDKVEAVFFCCIISNSIMKKQLLLLALFAVCSLYDYATPYEYWKKDRPCYAPKQAHLDGYLGSQKYKYLVGGLYQKGNVIGCVLYVDEAKGTMMLYSVNQDTFIPQCGEDATYANIKKAYVRNGWNLFSKEKAYYFCKNQHTMIYNRNWEDTDEHKLYIPYYLILESDTLKYSVNAYCTVMYKYERAVSPISQRMTETHLDGTQDVVYFHFDHAGWKEVPLEPQYVSGYITEE